MMKIRRFFSKGIAYAWYFSGCAAFVRLACRLVPAKRGRIVFDNFHGRGFGDHQKYIARELLRRQAPVEIVFLSTDPAKDAASVPPGIRLAKYAVWSVIRELARAEVWCSNQSWTDFIAWGLGKKKSQTYVQTFHGSLGIKRIGADIPSGGALRLWLRILRRDAAMIDYLISNSTWESEFVYRRRFFGCGDVRLLGHARNDILFENPQSVRAAVREQCGLAPDDRLVLYAPTYRAGGGTEALLTDFASLRDACERRFGGRWKVGVRYHPNWRNRVVAERDGTTVDLTAYPDMQELLVAADVLVTDYSSCIFDFMLTRRPAFVYASDLDLYENERGFYYPFSETPFPVARTPAELAENIQAFADADYGRKCEAFLRGKGCVEDGRAASRVADLILRCVNRILV